MKYSEFLSSFAAEQSISIELAEAAIFRGLASQ